MSNRDHIEGLMAASLYEPLAPEEQRELNAWLAAHPEDRAELDAMRRMIDFLPDSAPVFAGDLRPVLREEILRGNRGWRFAWSFSPRLVFQFAGVAFVTALLVVPLWQGMGTNFVAPVGEQLARLAPVQSPTAEAEALVAAGDYTGAHALLTRQRAEAPKAPEAGQRQLALARIEFENLGRYAQAYDAYEKLRSEYGAAFASTPENAYRFDVLEQTRAEQFEPLYTIAQAREKGAESFPELERLVARYSGRGNPVAELALVAMSDMTGALESDSGVFRVAAYEQVRNRVTDPVALAQLNDTLGQMYLDHTGDIEQARQRFKEVVECGTTPLAADAELSLASLEVAR